MRDGYHIIDSDTHVRPNAETIKVYASAALLSRWDELSRTSQRAREARKLCEERLDRFD